VARAQKYAEVALWLEARRFKGCLLDIGARDRIFKNHLGDAVQYQSADFGAGHDHQIDLECPLHLTDRSFEAVVALDVLEHVERIHNAAAELCRISNRYVIIALPNMAVFSKRWSYLIHGHLETRKYDLLPEHQGDRHRWLTTYTEMNAFVESAAHRHGFELVERVEEMEGMPGGRLRGALMRQAARWASGEGLHCVRCIYCLERKP